MIRLTYPDGSVREEAEGISVKEAISHISEGLERASLGAVLNGRIMGKAEQLKED